MKFVALALALFLAVGSQAASLQADPPSQLLQFRSIVNTFLNQAMESTKRVVNQLDDPQYNEFKVAVTTHLDNFQNQLSASITPLTDGFISTIDDATAELRNRIVADYEEIKAKPEFITLKETVERHLAEYKTDMTPIMDEYKAKLTNELVTLKSKLEPLVTSLQEKVKTNWEETQKQLQPVVGAAQEKISQHARNVHEMVQPYVEEYKEQARQMYQQSGSVSSDQVQAVREKLTPHFDKLKQNLQEIAQVFAEAINKN